MTGREFWTVARVADLKARAAANRSASEIADELGVSAASVMGKALALGIRVRCYTVQQAVEFEERASERARLRDRAKKAGKRKAKRSHASNPAAPLTMSRTSPEYRSRLPAAPDMTPSERRAFLAEAVRNTAAMRVGR